MRNARANQLELVVTMAAASVALSSALLPSKLSCRTTSSRGSSSVGAWARSGATDTRSAAATARVPLIGAPGRNDCSWKGGKYD